MDNQEMLQLISDAFHDNFDRELPVKYLETKLDLIVRILNQPAKSEFAQPSDSLAGTEVRIGAMRLSVAIYESTLQPQVVGHEKNGVAAYGLFQFHEATARMISKDFPELTAFQSTDQFLASIEMQIDYFDALVHHDIVRNGSPLRSFGPRNDELALALSLSRAGIGPEHSETTGSK